MAKIEEEIKKKEKRRNHDLPRLKIKAKNVFFTPRMIKQTLVSIKISYISNDKQIMRN